MDNLLVILIVVLAGGYIVKRFYSTAKNQAACGCGCNACETEATPGKPRGEGLLDLKKFKE
jgi:hypothetical protein